MLATSRASNALCFTPAACLSVSANRTPSRSFFGSILGPCPLRSVTHTKTLPYSSDIIFKAVSDVSGYPGFLPFAVSSQIVARDQNGYPSRARLTVGYEKFGLEEHWDNILKCDPEKGVVEASNDEGANQSLFEVLKAKWKIDALQKPAGQTRVKLDIDVKFRNQIYDQMFAQVEGKIAGTMISAFEKRVKELEAQRR